MTDCIRLAHTMNEGQDRDLVNVVMFDPFTDANDDYAVLEWMRKQGAATGAFELHNSYKANYFIGDYARAALKVIDD